MVTVLLREGADRDAEDVNGYHPLHYATMWGHTTTITALVEAGAALESATRVDGNGPLHIAVRYASAVTVQHLLGQGEEEGRCGRRPRSACGRLFGSGERVFLLYTRRVTVRCFLPLPPRRELVRCASCCGGLVLLRCRATFCGVPSRRSPSCQTMCRHGFNTEQNIVLLRVFCRLCLSRTTPGADKDAKNSRGFTALHSAAASNKVGAISLLLAEGASVDLPSGEQG